jgi:phosphinothricin acetyltransferase
MATIRLATTSDAEAIADIYAPYCDATVISFEETAPRSEEMSRRITAIGATRPWIVLEDSACGPSEGGAPRAVGNGRVVGYAYASPHHERAAYRWSVSTSIYIDRAHHRRGAGRALYTTLFALLRALGYRQATAGITLPNPASVGLHAAFGFVPVGVYRRIGYKMGGWHDVGWFQAEIQSGPERPADPRSIHEMVDTPEWHDAVKRGLHLYVHRT